MSARHRHLRNAPIREALIDLQVPRLADIPEQVRDDIQGRLGAPYQSAQALRLVEARIATSPVGGRVTSTDRPRGWLFRSIDETKVVQFRSDGFTFNRLRPYTNWEQVRDEALPLWAMYLERLQPAAIKRIAVRYINEMSFPTQDLDRYLDVPPRIPASLDYRIAGHFSQALIEARPPISARLAQALEPAVSEAVTVLLDIDVYRTDEHDVGDDRLRERLDELRDVKNRLFFSSITEEAATLWQ